MWIFPLNVDNILGTWIFPRNVVVSTIIFMTRIKERNLTHNLTPHLYSLHGTQHHRTFTPRPRRVLSLTQCLSPLSHCPSGSFDILHITVWVLSACIFFIWRLAFNNADTIFRCKPLKFTLGTNTATTPRKSRFCDGRNISTIIAADSKHSSTVMRQVLEDIQNQKYILRDQISSLSERDIRTAHPHSMDDVISPKMWRKFEDIIGEDLVDISSKAQVHLLYLAKKYERESQ